MILQELAPAKINLFLDIVGKRDDGFHDLRTVFAETTLCDVLQWEMSGGQPLQLSVSGPYAEGVPTDERNIIRKALSLSGEQGFANRLLLEKNIPHGAGLGGGSADAVAALFLLARQRVIPTVRMLGAAKAVGSDCAFFFHGGMAEATGRGEVIEPFPSRILKLLIVIPNFGISTVEAYRLLDKKHLGERSDVVGLRDWMQSRRHDPPVLENTFELVLDPVYPQLPLIRAELRHHGAIFARLSGSGSATFGVFNTDEARLAAATAMAHHGRCIVCNTVYHSGETRLHRANANDLKPFGLSVGWLLSP